MWRPLLFFKLYLVKSEEAITMSLIDPLCDMILGMKIPTILLLQNIQRDAAIYKHGIAYLAQDEDTGLANKFEFRSREQVSAWYADVILTQSSFIKTRKANESIGVEDALNFEGNIRKLIIDPSGESIKQYFETCVDAYQIAASILPKGRNIGNFINVFKQCMKAMQQGPVSEANIPNVFMASLLNIENEFMLNLQNVPLLSTIANADKIKVLLRQLDDHVTRMCVDAQKAVPGNLNVKLARIKMAADNVVADTVPTYYFFQTDIEEPLKMTEAKEILELANFPNVFSLFRSVKRERDLKLTGKVKQAYRQICRVAYLVDLPLFTRDNPNATKEMRARLMKQSQRGQQNTEQWSTGQFLSYLESMQMNPKVAIPQAVAGPFIQFFSVLKSLGLGKGKTEIPEEKELSPSAILPPQPVKQFARDPSLAFKQKRQSGPKNEENNSMIIPLIVAAAVFYMIL